MNRTVEAPYDHPDPTVTKQGRSRSGQAFEPGAAAYVETHADIQRVRIVDSEGATHQIKLPVNAMKLLVEILTQLGEGNTVSLTPVHAELTTQEAADLLNMSRPTFIKLLDAGQIPYFRAGNRRKVKYTDVMRYKEDIDQQREQTLEELSQLDQTLGMGY